MIYLHKKKNRRSTPAQRHAMAAMA